MNICKTVLSVVFTWLITITVAQAQCGNLYIAGIVDGPLPGGTPKGIQLCANGAIADLSIYGIESVTNGNGSNGTEEYTFEAIALSAGDCIWLTTDIAQFNAFFGFDACYEDNVIGVNGDDAVLLYCSTVLEDVAGDPDTDGSDTNWEYQDGWMYSSDTDANPVFDETEWTYSGADALDGETDNASAAIPYPNTDISCPALMVDCPALGLNIGAACDDANPTTSNDTVTASCNCEGTQSGEALCFTDTACDFEIVAVALNSQADDWSCNAGTYEANGFVGSGTMETSDLWLISGVYDFSGSSNITLQLDAIEGFDGSNIEIFYTTSYAGCPGDASNNWVSAGLIATGAGGTGLSIDLSGSAGSTGVYIGIQYLSGSAPQDASNWTLSNISLIADVCPTVATPVTSNCDLSVGCTDNMACNFDSTATVDDGSCFSVGDACDDGDPNTINDVYVDCSTCMGEELGGNYCSVPVWEAVSVVNNSQLDVWTTITDGWSMNGFCGGGCQEQVDQWLVYGPLDMSATSDLSLLFEAAESFGETPLNINFTTDYSSGCPSSTTWTLASTVTEAGTISIDLSGASSTALYIGIEYSDDGDGGYSDWDLTNFQLLSEACPTVGTPIVSSCDIANAGCISASACNFDPMATEDDGSCLFDGDPCTDSNGNPSTFAEDCTCPSMAVTCASSAKINEFHYDNDGGDVNEFVEIALPAGSDPTSVRVDLYNGSNGTTYDSVVLSASEFISSDGTSDYYVWVVVPQNGPDGIAVSCVDGTQYQFISYEGDFLATDGPFADVMSTDIGVEEAGNSSETSSIMCDDNGNYLSNCTADPGAANNISSCIIELLGCTTETACNYNPEATTDDGSCFSVGDSCDDGNPDTLGDVYTDCSTCMGETPSGQICDAPVWEAVSVINNSQLDVWTAITDGWSMNGFCGSGCAEQVDQWLIYGPLDMSGANNVSLLFEAAEDFTETPLNINFTSDYSAGCPSSASWTLASTIADAASINVDLSAATGSAVYIGIEYSDDGADGYSDWDLTNFQLLADACPTVGTPIVSNCGISIDGCTNDAACNYNPSATNDDGSCVVVGDACTDTNGNPSTIGLDCNCTAIINVTCATSAKINEFHYDNAGTDVNEFVEIALPAGSDPASVQINLYNGSDGTSYESIILSSAEYTSSNATSDFYVWSPTSIQNGPDGIAVSCVDGTQYQFITYEGSFMATDGPFAGSEGTDIGVEEQGDAPETSSIMCDGNGNFMANCVADAGATNNLSTCVTIVVGCTDPCDPNYNADATEDDPSSCAGYSTDCDDGDCNTSDSYDNTICACINTPIDPPNCDDSDCSTEDSYDSATCTCLNIPADIPDCDDNDCNTDDTYDQTNCVCVNTPISPPNCDDSDCSTADNYDSTTCTCVNTPIDPPNCDDGNCSNGVETYDEQNCVCVPGTPLTPLDCDDNDCNTEDVYDEATCSCINTPITPPNCDDGDCNTEDSYDSVNCICVNTLIGAPDCDDGDCNTINTYDYATCECVATPIEPLNCDDDICGTEDSYDSTTCTCINTPIEPPVCDDGICSNGVEIYNAETCECEPGVPGEIPTCDDGDCNTEDVYDEDNCICVNTPIDPPNCDDNDCNTEDAYDLATCTCVNTSITPPDCDDSNCNTLDSYDTTTCTCVNSPIDPPNCDDGICGTEDSYDSTTCTCVNMPIQPADCDSDNCSTNVWDPEICECVLAGIPEPLDCDDNDCSTTDIFDETLCDCIYQQISVDPDDGCEFTDDSYDAATCTVTNTPNCPAGATFNEGACTCDDVPVPGCTDPCAPSYNAEANTDDGSCEAYTTDCNQDCTAGSFGGNWDTMSCACINETEPVNGCTDSNATNYNPAANCDDGSCTLPADCTTPPAIGTFNCDE